MQGVSFPLERDANRLTCYLLPKDTRQNIPFFLINELHYSYIPISLTLLTQSNLPINGLSSCDLSGDTR
jgi:hypothetical protein